MTTVVLTIDGAKVEASEGETIIAAARKTGIYIPGLCVHPDLNPVPGTKAGKVVFQTGEPIEGTDVGREAEGCQLCLVEIEGRQGVCLACNTPVAAGMVIQTNTPSVQQLRRRNLAKILAQHPHLCLICPQAEGCSLTSCSFNAPEKERCCPIFSYCELRKVADYIGIPEGVSSYRFQDLPIVQNWPLFAIDYNLCIGGSCLRCIRACQDIRGLAALGFVYRDGAVDVGWVAPSPRESGCKFCSACVQVCPTGALRHKIVGFVPKLKVSPPVLPPEEWLKFEASQISLVPEMEGVIQLLDEGKEALYIKGSSNMRQELEAQLASNEKARYFIYKEQPMYTSRESELLQQFLQKHHRLPAQNALDDDLF